MKKFFWLIGLAALGCAHVVKDVSDCNSVTGEKRVECGACLRLARRLRVPSRRRHGPPLHPREVMEP